MQHDNKAILEKANAAITRGDHDAFLSLCTDDTVWTFVGEQVLHGKEAVRQYMAKVYREPPEFMVEKLIGCGDYVTALGNITMKDSHGTATEYSYCDVWLFRDGKMAALRAFVIKIENK